MVEGLQPVQLLAGLYAMALIFLGGFGLLRTGGDGPGVSEVAVLGVTLGPLQSWIYVGAGVLGLVWSLMPGAARGFGWLLFLGGGLLFVWGLMLNDLIAVNPLSALGDPLGLTLADGWWHLVTAVFGLVIAVLPARKVVYLGSLRVEPTSDDTYEDVPGWAMLPPPRPGRTGSARHLQGM